MKLHYAGKTDQAKADLARLAIIRREREEAAKKKESEKKGNFFFLLLLFLLSFNVSHFYSVEIGLDYDDDMTKESASLSASFPCSKRSSCSCCSSLQGAPLTLSEVMHFDMSRDECKTLTILLKKKLR